MIAMTTKNGKTVRLDADYHIDTGMAEYKVYCAGTRFIFPDFAPAARVYKDLSRIIEDGGKPNDRVIRLTTAARLMGYKVEEPGFCAKEVA